MVPTFASADEILNCVHSNISYVAVHSFGAVSVRLYKVSIAFESVNEVLKFERSNKCY